MKVFQYRILVRHLSLCWCAWSLLCFAFLSMVFMIFAFADDTELLNRLLYDGGLQAFSAWFLGQLPWISPIACFSGTLFCLLFLRQRKEWLAIQASGVPPSLALFVYLLLGLIPACLVWLASNRHQEKGDLESETLEREPLQMKIDRTRAWYFESFDEIRMAGNNLQLYSYDPKGNDSFRIRAEHAVFKENAGWVFTKGRFLAFPSGLGVPLVGQDNEGFQWRALERNEAEFLEDGFDGPLTNKSFDRLSLKDLGDDPMPHLLLRKSPKTLSLEQLNRILKEFQGKEDRVLAPYELRRAQILLCSPSCMAAIFFAFCIGFGRGKISIGEMIGVTLIGVIIFYVLRTSFDALGEEGLIEPALAAVFPYATSCIFAWVWYWTKR